LDAGRPRCDNCYVFVRILGLAILVVALVMLVAWGWKAAVSWLVIVGLLALIAFATGLGAEWLRGGSRGRFGAH
jgi:hypothetical protein